MGKIITTTEALLYMQQIFREMELYDQGVIYWLWETGIAGRYLLLGTYEGEQNGNP